MVNALTYSDRLRLALSERKMSPSALAAALGISAAAVSKVMLGSSKTLSVENHIRASRVLGISPEWLVEGDGEMEPGTAPIPAQSVANAEEAELVQIYRSLGEAQQAAMLAMARGLKSAKR
ncbi:helix-turn-helix domain-containing protein [Variovorax sp. tm]|uniref:helix-turn-helix domain-containing protein n=1 Tax=Variovorax atrisoli TaxID=3394203 RepID=UPI003A80DB5B